MRRFPFWLLFFFLLSCGDKPVSQAHIDSVLKAWNDSMLLAGKSAVQSDSFYWLAQGKLTPDEERFYPVYELSSQTQAIVFEVYYGPAYTEMDSVMQQIVQEHIYYDPESPVDMLPVKGWADTLGRFRLLHSAEVEEKFSAFLDGEFFIYCTKGIVKRQLKDVLFCANYCQSSIFALRFDHIDTVEYGHPLMASRKNAAAFFHEDAMQARINSFNDSMVKHIRDYSDTLPPKIYARQDSIFFVYYDNFSWPQDPGDKQCYFPGRVQYVIREGKIATKQWDSLDLFGVPCD